MKTTLFVNRLTVIDFSYLNYARGLLGESWLIDVELDGSLDHQGMVLDFGEVKKEIKRAIDLEFDHRLLIPTQQADCRIEQQGHRCTVQFKLKNGDIISHSGPNDAVTLIDAPLIDPQTLGQAITERLKPLLPDNVQALRIHLYPEQIDGAYYQYSHGLKLHAGNCQRIAHGHRSRIKIYRNGARDLELEAAWSSRWRGSYIGTQSDLLETFQENGRMYHRFGYTANQGPFKLQLPSDHCYLIESESTVENLAQHIADTLKREYPADTFLVKAFEGVDKGALGQS